MSRLSFCRKCFTWVGITHGCKPPAKRPKRTMGLEAGYKPLSDTEVEEWLNCYGPGGAGRLLATIEKRDATIKRLKAKVRKLKEGENEV